MVPAHGGRNALLDLRRALRVHRLPGHGDGRGPRDLHDGGRLAQRYDAATDLLQSIGRDAQLFDLGEGDAALLGRVGQRLLDALLCGPELHPHLQDCETRDPLFARPLTERVHAGMSQPNAAGPHVGDLRVGTHRGGIQRLGQRSACARKQARAPDEPLEHVRVTVPDGWQLATPLFIHDGRAEQGEPANQGRGQGLCAHGIHMPARRLEPARRGLAARGGHGMLEERSPRPLGDFVVRGKIGKRLVGPRLSGADRQVGLAPQQGGHPVAQLPVAALEAPHASQGIPARFQELLKPWRQGFGGEVVLNGPDEQAIHAPVLAAVRGQLEQDVEVVEGQRQLAGQESQLRFARELMPTPTRVVPRHSVFDTQLPQMRQPLRGGQDEAPYGLGLERAHVTQGLRVAQPPAPLTGIYLLQEARDQCVLLKKRVVGRERVAVRSRQNGLTLSALVPEGHEVPSRRPRASAAGR